MAASPHRIALYAALNLGFWVVLGVGLAIGGSAVATLPYLVLLFALCSSVAIDIDRLNGRLALLAIFLAVYFLYFGMLDVIHLFSGVRGRTDGAMLSVSESVILVGGALLVLGYRGAVGFGGAGVQTASGRDWSPRAIVGVGLTLWLTGIAATIYWNFFVVSDKTMSGTEGIARLSEYATSALILAQMLQPVGFLLLTYAWRCSRRFWLLAAVLTMIAVQVLFGFVIDVKGMALDGALLVIVAMILTEGRVPKVWLIGSIAFVAVAFPVFQAYRTVIAGNGVARTQVLESLGKTLDKVLAAEGGVNSGSNRAQTFFERMSLKGSVEMIVEGTEHGVPFQYGYTLEPILSTFLPRVLWSDKPDIPTGRIVNRVFHVSDQEETYISPSHLGELYWNFGWAGVVVGMFTIGALLGVVGRFNLAQCRTVTRLILMVMTINLLVQGFEGALASSYVVWLRSAALLGVLHLAFARIPVEPTREGTAAAQVGAVTLPESRPFPNLLA